MRSILTDLQEIANELLERIEESRNGVNYYSSLFGENHPLTCEEKGRLWVFSLSFKIFVGEEPPSEESEK